MPSSHFPPVSDGVAQKYSVGWVIAVYVEGVLLVLMTAIVVFGFIRLKVLKLVQFKFHARPLKSAVASLQIPSFESNL